MDNLIESLFDKISAYNIFNYLLPGVVFAAAFRDISRHTFFSGNVIVDVVVTYFVGMVLSRVGSLVIEPLFKWMRIVKYAKYEDYLSAEKKDSKLNPLLQENNTYRTLTAVFLVLLLMKIGISFQQSHPGLRLHFDWVWPIALFVLFALSYRKQTAYIRKRANSAKE